MWQHLKWENLLENLKIAFATKNRWNFVLKFCSCSTSWKQISKTHKNYKIVDVSVLKETFRQTSEIVKFCCLECWLTNACAPLAAAFWEQIKYLLLVSLSIGHKAKRQQTLQAVRWKFQNFETIGVKRRNFELNQDFISLSCFDYEILFFFLLLFSKTQANNTLEYRTAS